MTLVEIGLSDLPDEVVHYAFDQYPENLKEVMDEYTAEFWSEEGTELDYENQSISIHDTPQKRAFRRGAQEMIRHIESEVERGERNDYTLEDCKKARRILDDLL